MHLAIFMISFAFFNCARGRRFFDLVSSTVEGRLIAMTGMAATVALYYLSEPVLSFEIFSIALITLMLWCTPAWDAYWSAAIGNDPENSRLWGLAAMSGRMLLAIPCIAGLAWITGHDDRSWLVGGTPLMGLPYYIFGYMKLGKYTIAASELAVGAILGALVFFVTAI